MKIGKKPKPGVDGRPWGTEDADGNIVIRTWFEDQAEECVKLGMGVKVVPLKRRRKKITS